MQYSREISLMMSHLINHMDAGLYKKMEVVCQQSSETIYGKDTHLIMQWAPSNTVEYMLEMVLKT